MSEFDKSPDQVANDAKAVGQDAKSKAKDLASDAKSIASDAIDSGRAYAREAVNAAGRKIEGAKSQLSQSCEFVTKAIHDDPVKAVVVTAVLSSLITALLVTALRSDDRRY